MSRLTSAQRSKMPASQFALPGKGEGPKGKGAGSYPVDTPKRAAVAKAYAKRFASPAEQKTIDTKANAVIRKAGGHPSGHGQGAGKGKK